MFSGLTKEINSWLPSLKKETDTQEKDDAKDDCTELNSKEEDKGEKKSEDDQPVEVKTSDETKSTPSATSPSTEDKTKLPSLEMLGNVKSQVTSWFGSASMPAMPSIPNIAEFTGRLKKSDSQTVSSPTAESSNPGEESSSAAPLADEDSNAANVGNKAMEGAKNIGNFLYSAVNKAGQTVTEAGAKIKKTVEDHTIIGDFNKEQESFIKEKQSQSQNSAHPPWFGHPNEEQLKQECLNLSKDRTNFIRNPPPGVDFEFDYNQQYPIALITLNEDEELKKMRFELVPKLISEETFWRNYFYRISLITQANELSSLERENVSQPTTAADAAATRGVADEGGSVAGGNDDDDELDDVHVATRTSTADATCQDFISDSFNLDSQCDDLDEIKEEMKKLGIDSEKHAGGGVEEEWEKQLDEELHEFEMVQDFK